MEEKEVVKNPDANKEEVAPDTNEQLEEVIRARLKEQYDRGVRVGIMSLSKLVNDKLSDSSLPLMKRIAEVRKLCKIAPGIEKKYNEISAKLEEAVESATPQKITTIDGADLSDNQKADCV